MTEDTSVAVLSVGEKVHVVFRRLFPGDVRRHLVGQIAAVSGSQLRVEGYVFVFDEDSNKYQRKPERRTRVVSLSTHINLNVIPESVRVGDVFYSERDGGLVVTDGKEFSLDLGETA